MVGKVDARWREAVRSGQSELHLLDKFTLSVQLQRWVTCRQRKYSWYYLGFISVVKAYMYICTYMYLGVS